MNEEQTEQLIKEYLKYNLSIELKSETNDFMSTDASTRTCFTVIIKLADEIICQDSYTN